MNETEERLVTGFNWLATVTHEAYHQRPTAPDRVPYPECTHKTCRYAADVIRWARAQGGEQ